MVTESSARQPYLSVTQTLYLTVDDGFTDGLATDVSLIVVSGVHEYANGDDPVAVGDPPITVDSPAQRFLSEPASTVGF